MTTQYYTLTDVAQHVGKPKHKLQYVLTNKPILGRPMERFNNVRMFTKEDIDKIREYYRQRDIAYEAKKQVRLLEQQRKRAQAG